MFRSVAILMCFFFLFFCAAGPKIANFAFRDNLHEGMRTAVTCIVIAGDGPVTTKWLKDGRPLIEQELDVRAMQEDDGFISTLTFKNLTYKQNGNYTCISTNDVASGSFSATLTVKGRVIAFSSPFIVFLQTEEIVLL